MKVNLASLLGGLLGLVSLVLPWWTLNFSSSYGQAATSMSESLYLYQSTLSIAGASSLSVGNFWFSWVTFSVMLIASLLVLAASLSSGSNNVIADYGRLLLLMSVALSLFAVIVFPIGIQVQFSNYSGNTGLSSIGLFSSGTYSAGGTAFHYSTYLTFGFWVTVAATTAMLVAFLRYSGDQKEDEQEEPPPPEPPRQPYKKPVPRTYPPKRYPRF